MAECAVHPQPVLSWSIPCGSTRRPSRSASPAGAPTSKHVLPKCRLALTSCFASAARSSGQLVARDADRGRPLDNERTGGCSVRVRLRVRRPSSSELELVAPLTSFASFATWPTSPRLGRLKRAPGLRVSCARPSVAATPHGRRARCKHRRRCVSLQRALVHRAHSLTQSASTQALRHSRCTRLSSKTRASAHMPFAPTACRLRTRWARARTIKTSLRLMHFSCLPAHCTTRAGPRARAGRRASGHVRQQRQPAGRRHTPTEGD